MAKIQHPSPDWRNQEYADLDGRVWSYDADKGGWFHESVPTVFPTVDMLSLRYGPLQAWWPGEEVDRG